MRMASHWPAHRLDTSSPVENVIPSRKRTARQLETPSPKGRAVRFACTSRGREHSLALTHQIFHGSQFGKRAGLNRPCASQRDAHHRHELTAYTSATIANAAEPNVTPNKIAKAGS